MKNHPGIFTNNSIGDEKIEFETNFSYEAYSKNQSDYGDKLIAVRIKVVQIEENVLIVNDLKMTLIIGEDSNGNLYFGYKYNYTPDIYEGDTVLMSFLPLDYFSYENVYNNYVFAIASAIVNVSIN